MGLTTDSSSGPTPNEVANDGAIGHGCLARLSMRLTPPIFPEDAAEAFLVVVPPAVEINFPVESLLKHLKNVVSMLGWLYHFAQNKLDYKSILDYKGYHAQL